MPSGTLPPGLSSGGTGIQRKLGRVKNLPELCAVCGSEDELDDDRCTDKACCCIQQAIFCAGYTQAIGDIQAAVKLHAPELPVRAALNAALELVRKLNG